MTVVVPAGMPVLGSGAHDGPTDGACFMEYVSVLAGEEWADNPECVETQLALTMQSINDILPNETRQILVPLLTRSIGLAPKRIKRSVPGRLLSGREVKADSIRYLNESATLQEEAAKIYAEKVGVDVDSFTVDDEGDAREFSTGFMAHLEPIAKGEADRAKDIPEGEMYVHSPMFARVLFDYAVMLHEAYEEAMEQLGWERKTEPYRTVEQVADLVAQAKAWSEEESDEWYRVEHARIHPLMVN